MTMISMSLYSWKEMLTLAFEQTGQEASAGIIAPDTRALSCHDLVLVLVVPSSLHGEQAMSTFPGEGPRKGHALTRVNIVA